ncbi:ammonia-forming cytochrome c nitrite reductase subunit c552 [Candidatus Laterigemmans baculatus]|uniref:ammonia-forming cytochrome c nitrite reductase subunit c552 n=1 Tax=Candidatus Laterigemmans baculatus TaxID=2770505 RepID=UPI001F44E462|nr:ammonia-forming cytochrome c nitrite reductase subunit c552 [Candidatus Laterigemmans baculatus]
MSDSVNQPPADATETDHTETDRKGRRMLWLGGLLVVVALITFGVTAVLVTIFQHRQEARTPFVRLVEVNEISTDPVPWGVNWPHQFDSYRRAVDQEETEFGGSSAISASKLEQDPWLRRLYAGYAFSLDYREARGHAFMLYDQEVTERVTKRSQSGACLHCHASIIPTYRRMGLEARGEPADADALAEDFNWPAVMEGFRIASTLDYAVAHAELLKTPDGTPGENLPLFPGGTSTELPTPANVPSEPPKPDDDSASGAPAGNVPNDLVHVGEGHPVSCIDCHEPDRMQLRVTRPGFLIGVAALANSDDPLPHLPSIQRWREGNREEPYNPNLHASRQEMRSFVCGQCHVEYYCADKETLFYPWDRGLKIEQIEETYDQHQFPDGQDFYDFKHGETGAEVYKAQHPEFELWSQGIHARAGVSCADCHMPYERQGAMKVSSHWVRSPMLNINNACQHCHNVPEEELRQRVATIQSRTKKQLDRAAEAMTDMLDAIRDAQAAGTSDEELAEIFELQKKAMWRLDFISSENSKGFHADQEAVRILGESIDYSRQAQAEAIRLRAPDAPPSDRRIEPVQGVTEE